MNKIVMDCLSNRNIVSNIRVLVVLLQILKIKDYRFIFISVYYILIFLDYIEFLFYVNIFEVFGFYLNVEIGYYILVVRDMWSYLVEF